MGKNKGVVLETGKGWAIVLLPGGEYKKVSTAKPLSVGELYSPRPVFPLKYTVAAALFLLILVSTLDFFTVRAYARLSSGVELGINRWERVVQVNALETEGEQVIQGLDLKGKKVENALTLVVDNSLKGKTNQDDQEASILLDVWSKNANNKYPQGKLIEKIDRAMEKSKSEKGQACQMKLEIQNDKIMVKSVPVIPAASGEKPVVGKGQGKDKQNPGQQGSNNNSRDKNSPKQEKATGKPDPNSKKNKNLSVPGKGDIPSEKVNQGDKVKKQEKAEVSNGKNQGGKDDKQLPSAAKSLQKNKQKNSDKKTKDFKNSSGQPPDQNSNSGQWHRSTGGRN